MKSKIGRMVQPKGRWAVKTILVLILVCLAFACCVDCRAQDAGNTGSKVDKAGAVMGGVNLVGVLTETKSSVNQQKIDGNLKLADKFSQKAQEARNRGDEAAARGYEEKSNQWKDKAKELGWKEPAAGESAADKKAEDGGNPFGVLHTIINLGGSGESEEAEPERTEPAATEQEESEVTPSDFSGFDEPLGDVKSDIGREVMPEGQEIAVPESQPAAKDPCVCP